MLRSTRRIVALSCGREGLFITDDVSLSREICRREARRLLFREARLAAILLIALAIGISLFG